jgi:hypothetical protein
MARRELSTLALLVLAATSCGGGATPAESPKPAPSASTAPAEKPAAKPEAAEKTADAGAPAADKESKPQSNLDRPAKDIVLAEDTAFQSNFSASEAGIKADDACREKSEGDPKANADCLRDARAKFPVRIQRFVQKNGIWYWVIMEERGKQYVTLHRTPVEFAEGGPNTVTMRTIGKDEGLAPWGAKTPHEVTITVPNSFSIEIDDPQLGKVNYTAKIGMFPKETPQPDAPKRR